MAGYLAPNIAKNTLIPHGVQMLFKRTGTTEFLDLGDLSDVSMTPTVEFLEYSTSRFAKAAVAKRIGQNKGMTIEATVNEITPELLRVAFYGTAKTDVTTLTMTHIERLTVADNPSPDDDTTVTLSFTASEIVSVKSADGATIYTDTADTGGTDYTFSGPSATLTIKEADSGTGTIPASSDIVVEYKYEKSNADKIEIGGSDQQTGVVEFHIRNNEGGLGQVITLDDVHIATNGAIPLAPDAVQNFPITVTALVKNGTLGHIQYYDV